MNSYFFEIEKFNFSKNKITTSIIEGKITKPSIKFYQTIISQRHSIKRPIAGIGVSYFKKNCYLFNNELLKSYIYCSNEFSNRHDFWHKKKNMKFVFEQKHEREIFMHSICLMVLEHQNHSIREAMKHFDKIEEKIRIEIVDYYNSLILNNMVNVDKLHKTLDPITQYI